jgi:adenine-specific DNA-methyltransferase
MDNDNAIDQGRTARRISFFEHLETILKTNGDYVAEDGRLLRNKVAEAAATLDPALLRLLLADADAKKRFFTEVDGTEVFDKAAFGWVVENRAFLPDSFTRFKNRIGLADPNGGFLASSPDVVLSFPYKDCVLEGGQTKEDQKRSEVFYNRILAPDEVDRLLEPKALFRAVRHDKDGTHPATTFDPATDNLLLKGNNLLALATLLPRYEGKVQLVYIDPPFNTGGDDFRYNDSFNHSAWLVL